MSSQPASPARASARSIDNDLGKRASAAAEYIGLYGGAKLFSEGLEYALPTEIQILNAIGINQPYARANATAA